MTLQTFDPDCAVEEIVAAMDRDGACIIRNVLSVERLKALQEDTAPWIGWTTGSRDEWSGFKTKRTGGLIARCGTVREIAVDPLILAVAQHDAQAHCSKIQLNITQLITIHPARTGRTAAASRPVRMGQRRCRRHHSRRDRAPMQRNLGRHGFHREKRCHAHRTGQP